MDPGWLEYADSLYRYAVRLTGDPDEARDLVQETFLRFLRRCRMSRPDSSVKAYLFTILRHLWCRERRRQTLLRLFGRGQVPQGDVEGPAGVSEAWSDPELQALREADTQLVRSVLMCMPLPFQEVLLLREVEDLTYQDIARILDLPVGTVMSRLHRARALFKRVLMDLQASRRTSSDGLRPVASSDSAVYRRAE